MVRGVDNFRSFFKDFTDNYILIGGAACDEHFTEAGLTFRATKDLDIILIVEALNADFVKNFWEFVKQGEYEKQQKSSGDRKYYHFSKPNNEHYPFQLELFARNPDLLELAEGSRLTPIPADEDLSSLSAILLNEDYYNFTMQQSIILNNLHLAKPNALICLKAKAFIDLRTRKDKGEHIDEKVIRKHFNDVIRLAALLTAEKSAPLSHSIDRDMHNFMGLFEAEQPDYKTIGKTMGIPNLTGSLIIERINQIYSL
jgi:hypothetical protein